MASDLVETTLKQPEDTSKSDLAAKNIGSVHNNMTDISKSTEDLSSIGDIQDRSQDQASVSKKDTELSIGSDGSGHNVLPDVVPDGMTPYQLKATVRKQRKQMRKEQAMIQRKEKDKIKKERRKLERRAAGSKRPAENQLPGVTRAKIKKMSDESASNLTVAIDLNYEDLMSDKDMMKVMQQCKRCYAENRRANAPLQLYITSFSSRTTTIWDKYFCAYRKWDVYRKEESYIELFGKEKIVFLTSDSPNILSDLDSNKVYVIGGLVDHNHHKGYCYNRTQELGVAHAQLPLSQYVKLNCRTVLPINHVFEILLDYSANKDWKKALYKAIPPRKIVVEPSSSENITDGTVASEGVIMDASTASGSAQTEDNVNDDLATKSSSECELTKVNEGVTMDASTANNSSGGSAQTDLATK